MKFLQRPVLGGGVALFAALLSHAAVAQTLPPPPVSPAPVTTYEYDAQGNQTKVTKAPGVSGLNLETKATYDALYRVKDTTDPKSGKTQFQYDGGDRATQVTDPRSLVTHYPRNGFGDATQLVSPDTGTATHTYDEDGNLKTRLDSRGVLETYTYDGENRLTSVVYTQAGQTPQTVSWSYDLTGTGYANSIGRLSRTDHPNGASRFMYDPQGRVTDAIQAVYAASGANSATVTTTVKYGYTLGKLTSITYPSGRKLTFTYTGGQLTAMSLAKDASSTAVPLISQVKWEPFGPVSSWQWHMASGLVPHERFYDQYGRIVRYRLGGVFRDITYDPADRIVNYTHFLASNGTAQTALDQSFGYDENDQLISITTATASWSIAYDANGNRTSVTLNGSPSVYTTDSTSNRLQATSNPTRNFGYDNAGNTTSDSVNYTAAYNLPGALASLTEGGVTGFYTYDADKRRIRKYTSTGASSTVIFVYDLNGQLLGEYDSVGAALKEYIWLGSTPVAVSVAGIAGGDSPLVYYIHSDHLNAPRVVVDNNNIRRWRWLADPFGLTVADNNPDGIGIFNLNLRFPGQYSDAESSLFYNYRRSFDPSLGRYKESDPIGLMGRLGSTYGYAGGDPTNRVDPNGLFDSTTYTSPQTAPQTAPTPPKASPVPKRFFAPWAGPLTASVVLMCLPANIGPEASCNDDPRRERPECKGCRNGNHPDLFRGGNAQGPKLAQQYLRPNKEYMEGGLAVPGYGASTFESVKTSGRWWKLPASYIVPSSLCLRNDHDDHWLIEPASEMTLSSYASNLLLTTPAWVDMGNFK